MNCYDQEDQDRATSLSISGTISLLAACLLKFRKRDEFSRSQNSGWYPKSKFISLKLLIISVLISTFWQVKFIPPPPPWLKQ